jgi:hypothetical protein
MAQVTPRRPGLVALVRGDLRELATFEAAVLLARQADVPVTGCVLPVRPMAGLDLLRALAGDGVCGWGTWDDLSSGALGEVRALVVSGETWRRAARAVWPALQHCPVYVQRRRPAPPRSVLVAVDSARTEAALARRLAAIEAWPGMRITVAFASVPAWACSLSAALGCPAPVALPSEERLPWSPCLRGATGVSLPTTPQWGIRTLTAELRPDLVVMGLHRHRLREPWLAHPTAWHLSRELPTDVLICPVR